MGQRGYLISSNTNIKLWDNLWLFNWGVDNYWQQHLLLKNFIGYVKWIKYFSQLAFLGGGWCKTSYSSKLSVRRKFFSVTNFTHNLWHIWTTHILHYQTWVIFIIILYLKHKYSRTSCSPLLPINLYLYIKYLGKISVVLNSRYV